MIKRNKLIKTSLFILGSLIFVGLIAGNAVQYKRYTDLKENNLSTEQRIAKYEKEISKTYTLPTDDKATLADVKSAADLKKDEANKEFFKDAQDADILLIYTNNKLGILYRPNTKKIIKAGPVAYKQQTKAAIIGAKADRDEVIATLKQAFANDIATATEADPKVVIVTGQTIIVDVAGGNKDLVDRLAVELKGKVGDVPDGQNKPADGSTIAIYIAPAN